MGVAVGGLGGIVVFAQGQIEICTVRIWLTFRMTGYQQVIYFKQRRVMEFNKQKTLEKLRNEGVKGVPKDIAPPPPPGIQRKPT